MKQSRIERLQNALRSSKTSDYEKEWMTNALRCRGIDVEKELEADKKEKIMPQPLNYSERAGKKSKKASTSNSNKYKVKVHVDGNGYLMYSNEELGMKIWSDTSWNTRYKQAKKAYYTWKAKRIELIHEQEQSGLPKIDVARQVRSFDRDWKIDKLYKEFTKQYKVCQQWRDSADEDECKDICLELHNCITYDNSF